MDEQSEANAISLAATQLVAHIDTVLKMAGIEDPAPSDGARCVALMYEMVASEIFRGIRENAADYEEVSPDDDPLALSDKTWKAMKRDRWMFFELLRERALNLRRPLPDPKQWA